MARRIRDSWHIARKEGLKPAARYLFPRRASSSAVVDEVRIVFEAIASRTQQGTMVDVGAHYGYALRDFVRAGWQVCAFEPDAKNRERLLKRYGRYKNLHVDPRALSDAPCMDAAFFTSPQSSGISGLSAFHSSHHESARVQVTTLKDALAGRAPFARGVDFLKIDTEGFDLMVLRGLPWDEIAPTAILCEFEDKKTEPLDYRFHDIASYLTARAYRVIVSEWYPIEAYGENHRWRRFTTYPAELADALAWGNLIATNDEHLFDRLLAACGITSASAR
jgi:FkbM family methyltransferase